MIQQPKVEATAAPLLETAVFALYKPEGCSSDGQCSRGNLGGQLRHQVRGIWFHHQGVCLSCIPLELIFLYVNSCLHIYIFPTKKP